MKTTTLAILLLACGAAFANEATDDPARRELFAGERTRAEVAAELAAARQAGTLSANEYAANRLPVLQDVRSRSQARVEAVQAARSHAIHEQY